MGAAHASLLYLVITQTHSLVETSEQAKPRVTVAVIMVSLIDLILLE